MIITNITLNVFIKKIDEKKPGPFERSWLLVNTPNLDEFRKFRGFMSSFSAQIHVLSKLVY